MKRLPEELLAMVCRQLCFHCCNPDLFPDYDDKQRKEGQQALVNLCRVSRDLARIAQPILYHCFADDDHQATWKFNNLPTPTGPPTFPLPLLLKTLLQRPDLANKVCAMRLSAAWRNDSEKETDFLSSKTRNAFSFVAQSALDKGILSPIDDVLFFYNIVDESGLPKTKKDALEAAGGHQDLYDEYGLFLSTWMAFYATTLCPRLETLNLVFGWPFTETLLPLEVFAKQPALRLSSLRNLALDSHSGRWHPSMHGIMGAAPNLESLYIPNYYGTLPLSLDPPEILIRKNTSRCIEEFDYGGDVLEEDTVLPVTSLTSLSIVKVSMTEAEDLFHNNPRLETVVFYTESLWTLTGQLDFGPISNTLTSLCICSQHTWILEEYDRRWNFGNYATDWAMLQEVGKQTTPLWPQLRDLPKLQHLAIDCWGLQGPGGSQAAAADYLIKILPPTIRTLRIGWVYMSLKEHLTLLATVASSKFPCLKEVGVGIAENRSAVHVGQEIENEPRRFSTQVEGPPCPTTGRAYPAVLREMESIGELFGIVGIDFAWRQDWLFSDCNQVIPLSQWEGGPRDQNLPTFTLGFEGPEWYRSGDKRIRDGTMEADFAVYQVVEDVDAEEENVNK